MPSKSCAKAPGSFKKFNSTPEVIRLAVMMCVRFPLSRRNVEDLLFERGIDVCHETGAALLEQVRSAVRQVEIGSQKTDTSLISAGYQRRCQRALLLTMPLDVKWQPPPSPNRLALAFRQMM